MTRLTQALQYFNNQTKVRTYVLRTALPERHRKVLQKAKAITSIKVGDAEAYQLVKPA
jgi:hypothetical protein